MMFKTLRAKTPDYDLNSSFVMIILVMCYEIAKGSWPFLNLAPIMLDKVSLTAVPRCGIMFQLILEDVR